MDHYLDFPDGTEDPVAFQQPYLNHHAAPIMPEAGRGGYYHHQQLCDIKPRLTKDQHDILESHYQSQHKPNTHIKKGYADRLGVSLEKVNVSPHLPRPEMT